MFAGDIYIDSLAEKDKELDNSGYYVLMELVNLNGDDYTESKTQLETIKERAFFKELASDPTKPMIISPKDLPEPDLWS